MDIVDRLNGNAPSIMAMRDGAEEIMRLRRELYAARTKLSEGTKSVHWVATSERLPPTGYAVLVSGDGWQNVAAHFGERSDVGWLSCQDGLELKRPTHWMLLPDAPIQPHKPNCSPFDHPCPDCGREMIRLGRDRGGEEFTCAVCALEQHRRSVPSAGSSE